MFSLVLKTIRHFHRQLLPVILGVAVAGAIISGALIVGDSVRGSLRTIAMDRIGDIDRIVLAPRWFSVASVLPEADQSEELQSLLYISQATASFLPPNSANSSEKSAESTSANRTLNRANEMSLLGVSDAFWKLGSISPKKHPSGEQVILNQTLADALHAQVGSQITLRVAANALVPAESVLGKRDADTYVLPRWEVIEIVPDQSLGRFSLRSDQRPVMNAFVDREALQSALDIVGQVNAIASATTLETNRTDDSASVHAYSLLTKLNPQLTDLGFNLETISIPDGSTQQTSNTKDAPKLDASSPTDANVANLAYDHVTTDQMLISDRVEKAMVNAVQQFHPQPILTYLANGVEIAEDVKNAEDAPRDASQNAATDNATRKSVPYSTISAVDWSVLSKLLPDQPADGITTASATLDNTTRGVIEGLPPGSSDLAAEQNTSKLQDRPPPKVQDWVVINQWLADELNVRVGDRLKIDYFLPETVEGVEIEKSFESTIVAIAPLTTPKTPYRRNRSATFEQPPTPFNDPHWTPTVPGITDQDSISNWETPFPLKRTINDRDDEYWNNHRLTPKLFVSYERGKELFGSRFGNTTSLRFASLNPSDRTLVDTQLRSTLKEKMPDLGWREIPLREQQLARSGGSTQFDGLFMALSFFVIAAALMLVVLLFRLSIERRANHWGLLAASGWSRNKVRGLLLGEGAFLAAIGATIGIVLGTVYAYIMLALLKSWWIGAIAVSFLDYHLNPLSLVIGWVVSFIAAMSAIFVAARRLKRSEISGLLRGRLDGESVNPKVARWRAYLMPALFVGGIACLAFGHRLRGQEQAMCFVGGGMLFMISGLIYVSQSLSRANIHNQSLLVSFADLARSGVQRSPTRTLLAIAMIAMASFLILSLSLFQASPTSHGTGGFTWVGKSSSSIYLELDNPEARREHLGPVAEQLKNLQIASMRVRGGDDASCNNLYQANEPQIWGISNRIIDIDQDGSGTSRFSWFQRDSQAKSPWSPLAASADGTAESPIPVVLDQNTALWALHLGGYIGEEFSYQFDGVPIHFRVAGVLQNTILQGGLIIGEANFQKLFPSITGYRSFLVQCNKQKTQADTPEQGKPLDVANISSLDEIKTILENGWEEQGLSLASSNSILEQLLAVQNTYLAAFQLLGSLGLMLGTLGLAVTQLRSVFERQSELASMRAIGFSRERLTWLLALEAGWQLLLGLGIGAGAALLATLPSLFSGQPFAGFGPPLVMLLCILGVGAFTCWIAAQIAMKTPLLASLRSDS